MGDGSKFRTVTHGWLSLSDLSRGQNALGPGLDRPVIPRAVKALVTFVLMLLLLTSQVIAQSAASRGAITERSPIPRRCGCRSAGHDPQHRFHFDADLVKAKMARSVPPC